MLDLGLLLILIAGAGYLIATDGAPNRASQKVAAAAIICALLLLLARQPIGGTSRFDPPEWSPECQVCPW